MEKEEDDNLPDDVKPVKDLYLSESDSIGYLLKYENSILTVQSAIYYLHGKNNFGPRSITEIEVKEDVELFELPMLQYLKQYVLKIN